MRVLNHLILAIICMLCAALTNCSAKAIQVDPYSFAYNPIHDNRQDSYNDFQFNKPIMRPNLYMMPCLPQQFHRYPPKVYQNKKKFPGTGFGFGSGSGSGSGYYPSNVYYQQNIFAVGGHTQTPYNPYGGYYCGNQGLNHLPQPQPQPQPQPAYNGIFSHFANIFGGIFGANNNANYDPVSVDVVDMRPVHENPIADRLN